MDNRSELEPQEQAQQGTEGRKLLELAEDEGELERKAQRRKKRIKDMRDWVVLIVCTLAAVFVIRTFVFEPIYVDGPSMNNTLYTGDRVFVTKFDYLFGEPERGQVVICHYPNSRENYIKRLIGLPGDTIEISVGVTYLNGEALKEDFIDNPTSRDFGPITLGEGEYFVMGDNRANSNDSRMVGPLSKSQIVGHVRFLFFPFNRIQTVEQQYID